MSACRSPASSSLDCCAWRDADARPRPPLPGAGGAPGGGAVVAARPACPWPSRRGRIGPGAAEAVVAVARALPHNRRRWDDILGRAVEAGLDAEMAWRIEQLVARGGDDLRIT